jgi:hypothetical protein
MIQRFVTPCSVLIGSQLSESLQMSVESDIFFPFSFHLVRFHITNLSTT